jgi:hypothetical protein
MKKLVGFCVIFSLLASSCQKQIPKQIEGYFYTNDLQENEEGLKLYFDGKEEGAIPSLALEVRDISVIDSALKQKTLHKSFMSGKHLIELRTSSGKTLSSAYIYFEYYKHKSKTGMSSAGSEGGTSSMRMFDEKMDAAIMISSAL